MGFEGPDFINFVVELPVAGLMSDAAPDVVAAKAERLTGQGNRVKKRVTNR